MDKAKQTIKEKVAQQKRHWVRITRACNNSCLFCLDRENQNGSIFALEKIVLDLKAGLATGARRVVLSGGDPTVHPQLAEIIQHAKRLGYEHVQIITNGRMLAYEKFAKKLKQAGLDEVTLSLHSHLEKDFEIMTGVAGSYKQALQGLLNAQKQGFIVSVDIVINKINYKKLKETLQFYMKLGVSEFDLLYPIPFGSAWQNRKKLFFDPVKAQKYLKVAFDLAEKRNLFLWTNRMPAPYLEGFEDLIQSPLKLADEVRGMRLDFEKLIDSEKPMPCKGERCQYCFMQGFCADLQQLIVQKKIVSKCAPKCFTKSQIKKPKQPVLKFDKNFTLDQFTDFYIQNRYFVKSLRCQKCQHNDVCQGVWIAEIREKGFSILNPKL